MNNQVYFLIGVKLPHEDRMLFEESMKELDSLVYTAGGQVIGSMIQNRKSIDPAYYIGKGKLEEIDFVVDITESQELVIVVNASLSPAQVKNIESVLECRVITRTELILDIFAVHAQSQIAKMQVEKAQLSYLLPRLVGQGSSMSRTGAGIGTRGPGETKLETDRRKINRRISLLNKELKNLEKSSQERRKSRQKVFKIALAGYTNAGKSNLAVRLVKEKLLVQDKLFSTLDTTTRQLQLNGLTAVLTDTVGFIRDIPHELIDSFKSTLAETVYADLIFHVVDASSVFFEDKMMLVNRQLEEMDVSSEVKIVFNKIDLLADEQLRYLHQNYPDAFFISAQTGRGVDELQEYLKNGLTSFMSQNGISVPVWMDYQ